MFPGSQPDTWSQPRATLPPPAPALFPARAAGRTSSCSQPECTHPPRHPQRSLPQPVSSVLRPEPSQADNRGPWGRPGHPPMLMTLPGAPRTHHCECRQGRRSLRGAAEDSGRLGDLPPLSAPRLLSPAGGRRHRLHQAGRARLRRLETLGLHCGSAQRLAPQALAKMQRCLSTLPRVTGAVTGAVAPAQGGHSLGAEFNQRIPLSDSGTIRGCSQRGRTTGRALEVSVRS